MKGALGVMLLGLLSVCAGHAEPLSSPVVVELFESEGCSSCPPAERVMSQLKQEFGESVILLTFHVDYWDYLGWKDVFSDARYTARQKMYGQAFRQDSIYTPEIVIGGEIGFNGSDLSQASAQVRSRFPQVRPSFLLTAAPKTPQSIEVSISLPSGLAKSAREIAAIVVEDAGPVHVLRGENGGETMSGNFAVRFIKAIPESQKQTVLTLPAGGNPDRSRIVVLVRGPSAKILSAQSIAWPKVESASTPRK